MLCQVSTSSIRVKLRHQWDQRRGFDCSSLFPSFLWDALVVANFCMQPCFTEQIRAIVVKAIHWSHASEGRSKGCPYKCTYLSAFKPRYSFSTWDSVFNILKQLFKRQQMLHLRYILKSKHLPVHTNFLTGAGMWSNFALVIKLQNKTKHLWLLFIYHMYLLLSCFDSSLFL